MRVIRHDGRHEAQARLALTRRDTMNVEDEEILSAYLDGELEPDERQRIDERLLSDPALAERVRQLSAVRELVASLSRPALGTDLSPALLARISAQASPQAQGRRRLWRVLEGLAVAASVAGIVAFGFNARPGHEPGADRVARVQPVGPATPGPIANPSTPRADGSETEREPSAPPAASVSVAAAGDAAELGREREALGIRDLVDSPYLRRVIVVDAVGGQPFKQVDSLIQKTPRIDPYYARFTISQGIVIDPRHPNTVTVYALVMDDKELKQLEGKLLGAFPGAVQDTVPDPAAVTMLADIDTVTIHSGTRASDLVSPPENSSVLTALLAESKPKSKAERFSPVPEEFDNVPVRPVDPLPPLSYDPAVATTTPEREMSAPPATPSPGSNTRRDDPAALVASALPEPRTRERLARGKASIVLVWVKH